MNILLIHKAFIYEYTHIIWLYINILLIQQINQEQFSENHPYSSWTEETNKQHIKDKLTRNN